MVKRALVLIILLASLNCYANRFGTPEEAYDKGFFIGWCTADLVQKKISPIPSVLICVCAQETLIRKYTKGLDDAPNKEVNKVINLCIFQHLSKKESSKIKK